MPEVPGVKPPTTDPSKIVPISEARQWVKSFKSWWKGRIHLETDDTDGSQHIEEFPIQNNLVSSKYEWLSHT